MTEKSKISILGCGWLGVPLAVRLIETNHQVKGSYRNGETKKSLVSNSIEPYEINLTGNTLSDNTDGFFETDCLVISIPPRKAEGSINKYVELFLPLIKKINKCELNGVVFLSSTSVYPSNGDQVVESNDYIPDKPVGHAILEVENLLKESLNVPMTILRLAGLIGGERVPQNYLKNKSKVRLNEGPVNLIHRDDCIRIIEKIIQNNIWMETINVCCDAHPTRKEYYQAAADKFQFQLPEFEKANHANFKIVDNHKLKMLLGEDILEVNDPLSLFY